MAIEILDALRLAVLLDVLPARVDGPDRIRDLAPDELVVVGVAGAQRDVRLALGEVEILVAHDELDPDPGVAGVEAVEQRGLRDAVDQGLGAGHADDADHLAPRRFEMLLEGQHRLLHPLGVGDHLLAELGQAVARGVALHERTSDAPLERHESALHGRLVHLQRPAGCKGAVMTRDGEIDSGDRPSRTSTSYALAQPPIANMRLPPSGRGEYVRGTTPRPRTQAMDTAALPDSEALKTAARNQWDKAAAGWNHHTPWLRAWLRGATDAMLDMAGIRSGSRVLDVAAGAGDQTLDIAERVGPQGRVLATDLSPAILELAKENALRAGYGNVETCVADGECLQLDEPAFDAAVCRLGLMFFPDPLRGLREMHRALKPGGGICTMVFSKPEANPCITILMSTALEHAGLPRATRITREACCAWASRA